MMISVDWPDSLVATATVVTRRKWRSPTSDPQSSPAWTRHTVAEVENYRRDPFDLAERLEMIVPPVQNQRLDPLRC
jgi:hypothetical protein